VDQKCDFPQLAVFDGALRETEIQEARGASRGNVFRGPRNVISLACGSGFEASAFLPEAVIA